MSDIEEPPAKLTKVESSERAMEKDTLGEGQEEWLSEEILTDDDNQASQENTSNVNTSQESQDSLEHLVSNPEQPNLDNRDHNSQLKDHLDEFLIRKNVKNEESDLEESTKQSNDDGNDTDDLLRMLGDDGKGKNKQANSDNDDDDFVFGGPKGKQQKGEKGTVKASKAVPEDSSDDDTTDASSDENLMKIMLKNKTRNVASKSTSKSSISNVPHAKSVQSAKTDATSSTPIGFMDKKYHNKSLMKPLKPESKMADRTQIKPKTEPSKLNGSRKPKSEHNSDNEEALDEDFEYDDGLMDESERRSKLPLMKPERMDEDFPTDEESMSGDDDSIYDELPTTDSEMDDWFDLDIRAERASDYLPLLGEKAQKLLLEEKARVTERVTELRRTLKSLAKTGREQAEALQKATLTLAELDTMLKTT